MSVILLLSLVACSGGQDAKTPEAPKAAGTLVPAALVSATWQVRLAKDDVRAPFEGRGSWVAYFQGKRSEALGAFKSESDAPGLARAHTEYAAMYRLAARAGGNAARIVYGELKQPTDPVEAHYLAAVGGLLEGTPDAAAGLAEAKASKIPAVVDRAGQWAAGGLAKDTEPKGAVEPGSLPGAELAPWSCPLVGEPGAVDLGDPTDLLALARWHEAAALAADPSAAGAIQTALGPYRFGLEAAAAPAAPTWSDTWVFMSPYTSGEDLQFAAELSTTGTGALATWAPKSAYAAAVSGCIKDQKLSVDCMVDESVALGRAIETGMSAAAGKTETFHRAFADYARAGVLRAGAAYAAAAKDDDAKGRLYILALDKNLGAARDPAFLLQIAAWDAGNRNTPRAEELLHELEPNLPALATARSVVDALHVRLSRNAAPGLPMN